MDPAHPLCGQSFPLVRLRRHGGRWVATLRLPTGDTRAVPMTAIQGSEPELPGGPQMPVPDFRELWKRREWIRALADRTKAGTENQPQGLKGPNNGAAQTGSAEK